MKDSVAFIIVPVFAVIFGFFLGMGSERTYQRNAAWEERIERLEEMVVELLESTHTPCQWEAPE